MKRLMIFGLVAIVGLTAAASAASAQVFVRAPFVRVRVGPGVAVRAPFVNLYVPPAPAYYYPPTDPTYVIPSGPVPPPPTVQQQPAAPPIETGPLPKAIRQSDYPPPPIQGAEVPTLEQFAKGFQPKAGAYEVDLINPVTNQPTKVRFTLPQGTPKSVQVRGSEIEFRYGLLRFVRIEFDKDGAQVISR